MKREAKLSVFISVKAACQVFYFTFTAFTAYIKYKQGIVVMYMVFSILHYNQDYICTSYVKHFSKKPYVYDSFLPKEMD